MKKRLVALSAAVAVVAMIVVGAQVSGVSPQTVIGGLTGSATKAGTGTQPVPYCCGIPCATQTGAKSLPNYCCGCGCYWAMEGNATNTQSGVYCPSQCAMYTCCVPCQPPRCMEVCPVLTP